MFDVSHMGEIETSGPDAERFLQHLLSNDLTKLAEGGAQYSVLCRADGGVLDDLFTYRLPGGRFLTVTNAANHAKDLAWFREAAGRRFDAEVRRRARRLGDAGRAGPRRPGRAGGDRRRASCRPGCAPPSCEVAGVPALVCGTGYTGEDGCELMVPPDAAPALWDALLEQGVRPAGLGARDTLRLEVCFHLYGNDLSEDRNPIEAGLGWCCKLDTGFVGAEALAAASPRQTLGAVRLHRPRHPAPGQPGGGAARRGRGDQRQPVALPRDRHRDGLRAGRGRRARHPIEVDVRGKARAAEVREKPLVGHKRPARPGAQ